MAARMTLFAPAEQPRWVVPKFAETGLYVEERSATGRYSDCHAPQRLASRVKR
jgi:hypothetical protein